MIEPCQHARTDKRKRTLSNGVVTVALQCLDCGKMVRSLPKSGENMTILPEFDFVLQQRERIEREIAWAKQSAENSDEFWRNYNAYLGCGHWQKLRRLILNRDPFCQVCFVKQSVQAHHLSYDSFKRYGFSFVTECVGVCYDCHFKILHPEKTDA